LVIRKVVSALRAVALAVSVDPPPLVAWKYCPPPARMWTESPLVRLPPFTSMTEKVSHACIAVAVAVTVLPPLLSAPKYRGTTVVRSDTFAIVVSGGGGGGVVARPLITRRSHVSKAGPFALTELPPPFAAETQWLVVTACRPTTSPFKIAPVPVCFTMRNVSHPSRFALAAFSEVPPPLTAWKYCPFPARMKTVSPLSSAPPLMSSRPNFSQACATVAVAMTAPPPLFCAPMKRPAICVLKLTPEKTSASVEASPTSSERSGSPHPAAHSVARASRPRRTRE
jgi:hypothetical protein